MKVKRVGEWAIEGTLLILTVGVAAGGMAVSFQEILSPGPEANLLRWILRLLSALTVVVYADVLRIKFLDKGKRVEHLIAPRGLVLSKIEEGCFVKSDDEDMHFDYVRHAIKGAKKLRSTHHVNGREHSGGQKAFLDELLRAAESGTELYRLIPITTLDELSWARSELGRFARLKNVQMKFFKIPPPALGNVDFLVIDEEEVNLGWFPQQKSPSSPLLFFAIRNEDFAKTWAQHHQELWDDPTALPMTEVNLDEWERELLDGFHEVQVWHGRENHYPKVTNLITTLKNAVRPEILFTDLPSAWSKASKRDRDAIERPLREAIESKLANHWHVVALIQCVSVNHLKHWIDWLESAPIKNADTFEVFVTTKHCGLPGVDLLLLGEDHLCLGLRSIRAPQENETTIYIQRKDATDCARQHFDLLMQQGLHKLRAADGLKLDVKQMLEQELKQTGT